MSASYLGNPFFCESRDNFPPLPPLEDSPDTRLGPDDSLCSSDSDCDVADGLPIELRSDLGVSHFPLPPSDAPVWNLGDPCANVLSSWLERDTASIDAWWIVDAPRVLGGTHSRRLPVLHPIPPDLLAVQPPTTPAQDERTPVRQRAGSSLAVVTRLPHGRRALLSPAPRPVSAASLRPHPPLGSPPAVSEVPAAGAALGWPFTRERSASSSDSAVSDDDGGASEAALDAGEEGAAFTPALRRSTPLHVHWGLAEAQDAEGTVNSVPRDSLLALSTTLADLLPSTPQKAREPHSAVRLSTPVSPDAVAAPGQAPPAGASMLELSVGIDVASWTGLTQSAETPPQQPVARGRRSSVVSPPASSATPPAFSVLQTPGSPRDDVSKAVVRGVPAYLSPALQRRHASAAVAHAASVALSSAHAGRAEAQGLRSPLCHHRCDTCGLATLRRARFDDAATLYGPGSVSPHSATLATPRHGSRGGSVAADDPRAGDATCPTPYASTPAMWTASSASGISLRPLTPLAPQSAPPDAGGSDAGCCSCRRPPPDAKPHQSALPHTASSPSAAPPYACPAMLGGVLGALAEARAFSPGTGGATPDGAWDYALWRSRGAILPAPSSPMSPPTADRLLRTNGAAAAPPLPSMPPVRWQMPPVTAVALPGPSGSPPPPPWPAWAGAAHGGLRGAPAAAAVAPRRLTFVG